MAFKYVHGPILLIFLGNPSVPDRPLFAKLTTGNLPVWTSIFCFGVKNTAIVKIDPVGKNFSEL